MFTCGPHERALAAVLVLATVYWSTVSGEVSRECEVLVRLDSGLVCGGLRRTYSNNLYASFRGVPYAKQPLGQLRFKELQPAERWEGVLGALKEGPRCPQHDVLYNELIPNQITDEACIHANIHVPKDVLPSAAIVRQARGARYLQPPYPSVFDANEPSAGAPILVFVHGGGFAMGAGDASFHGPEHLVEEGAIVITFNYRINVFGFLSLNSTKIPGNNGLRDIITLLRWVKRNARAFGGDPDNVTLGGQSSGASSAHLVSLSNAARGLFKRLVLMSGTAIPTFYTTTPAYAQVVADLLIKNLGINSTDPDIIHDQLVETPLEAIMAVNKALLDQFGLTVFLPVIESLHPGVERILDEDTEVALANGRGNSIPLLIGYVSKECETFRPRFQQIDIMAQLKINPVLLVPPQLIFTKSPESTLAIASKIQERYFNETPNLDQFVKACSDQYYEYPALKVAKYRQARGAAPTFLYRFSYDPDYSALKYALKLEYNGSAHIEDQTFVFQVNSLPHLRRSARDDSMKRVMTNKIINFMRYSDPSDKSSYSSWQQVTSAGAYYQSIERPEEQSCWPFTEQQSDLLFFQDSLRQTDGS